MDNAFVDSMIHGLSLPMKPVCNKYTEIQALGRLIPPGYRNDPPSCQRYCGRQHINSDDCSWPLTAPLIGENMALRIAVICHKAEIGLEKISASRTAGNGQKRWLTMYFTLSEKVHLS